MLHGKDQAALEQQLNGFLPTERRAALEALWSRVLSGEIVVSPVKEEVNLHFHTFFSFNAEGWSPSRIAWESVKYGLEASGIVDFDVLDGMGEFLSAGDLLGLKSVVGLETRVFVPELSQNVISSPNEPGVAYFMAAGCFRRPTAGSEEERILLSMAQTAKARNVALIERVNAYLDQVQLDYDTDVMPLTPSGNATERHLLTAYDNKARQVFGGDSERIAGFWAEKLGIETYDARALLSDTPKFHERLRSKLMKFGGVGYIPPESGSFPPIEDAVRMMQGMGALPTATWLDGTNPGEAEAVEYLGLLQSKGIVAANIVPDRNWRVKDPAEKALKTRKLREFVDACRAFEMPIAIGTEMNKAGLPFVDDFSAPELQPYIGDFLDGARCLYGHTLLARYADFGYTSPGSLASFGDDMKARRDFFTRVGQRIPSADALDRLLGMKGSAEPGAILEALGVVR